MTTETKHEPELRECPFCGSPAVEEVGPSFGCSRWRIVCDDCGAEGPPHGTEQGMEYTPTEAIAAWNTRASDARIAELEAALETAAIRLEVCAAWLQKPARYGTEAAERGRKAWDMAQEARAAIARAKGEAS